MLTKPRWNYLEVRTFRGVLTAMERTLEGEAARKASRQKPKPPEAD